MKKNLWINTVPHRIPYNDVPGVYSASTESGKVVYSYSKNPEEAFNSSINSISRNDRIISVGREHL